MGTQWRVSASMSGMIWTGLDYNALPIVEARLNVPRETVQNSSLTCASWKPWLVPN
jgi:hypothetical protein